MRNKINPLTELWISNELNIMGFINKKIEVCIQDTIEYIATVQILNTLSVTFAY